MPLVPFDSLPPDARVWVFASDTPLDEPAADTLLSEVDRFLEDWHAHGEPLRSARTFSDAHFLAIGVDPTTSNASGCSIDGLFRTLQKLEPVIGAKVLGGGRVFFRESSGAPRMATRQEFAQLARGGEVTRETPVYDTSLTTASALRAGFVRPAGESWAAPLFERA